MNCLETTLSREGGVTTELERLGDRVTGSATRVCGLTVSFGLFCPTNLGGRILWASDQMVLTVEGNKIYVVS